MSLFSPTQSPYKPPPTTEEMFEHAMLALIDEGRFPTNEEMVRLLTGNRDDEFYDDCQEEARRILKAALED